MQICRQCQTLVTRRSQHSFVTARQAITVPFSTRWQCQFHTHTKSSFSSCGHTLRPKLNLYGSNQFLHFTSQIWGISMIRSLCTTFRPNLVSTLSVPNFLAPFRKSFSVERSLSSREVKMDQNKIEVEADDMTDEQNSILPLDENAKMEPELEELVRKLKIPLSHKDDAEIRSYLEPLLSLSCKARDIIVMFVSRPELAEVSLSCWNEGLCLLTESGFYKKQMLSVITGFPAVFTPNGSRVLADIVEALRQNGFREKTLQKLLANNPEILLIPPSDISAKMENLKTLFKTVDAIHFVLRSPNILMDSWEDIKMKFDYVTMVMGVNEKEITKSALFMYSLHHIKCRHLFLERAGLYEKPDKHGATKIVNPRLSDIVDTPDNHFAIMHANMCTEDYHVFCKMIENEDPDNLSVILEDADYFIDR